MIDLETIYIIRCSDGWMGCTSEGYEMAVQLAQEHIEGTDLTYVEEKEKWTMYEVATQQSGEMVSRNTQTEMMISRQAQEVQGAMVIAKRFPRDEVESFNRIMQSCKRKSLAESAMYEYPRGGTKVSGPSIRLAEAMAQNWGNIDFGITELEQKNGESQVMAYAWDLETNTRQVKIFSVPHVRGTKKGNVPLTDPRDVYEMVANQGARRLRSCILDYSR